MTPPSAPFADAGRVRPARGNYVSLNRPTIVFLTVCTKNRQHWLAQASVHFALRQIWSDSEAWLVGDYLLMPDHLHIFSAPRNLSFSLERWVVHWKRKFSCLHLPGGGPWLRNYWDTRLRASESYSEKWQYVQENPVRAGLVARPEDWPFKGQLNALRW